MANRPGVQRVATSHEKNNDDNNKENSHSSKDEGVDLDEQRHVVAMAFDQDSEDAEEKEEDESSLGSLTKATKKKLKKTKRVLPYHRHKTPPRKAKKIRTTLIRHLRRSPGTPTKHLAVVHRLKKIKMDPEIVLMQEQHNDAMRLKKSNLQEMVRHNKVMESSALWDNRLKELEDKSNLMEKYKNFRKQGYSRCLIATNFPEMRVLCELEDSELVDDDDEKKPSSKKRKSTFNSARQSKRKKHEKGNQSDSESQNEEENSDEEEENSDDSLVVVEVRRKKKKIHFQEREIQGRSVGII